MARPGRPLFMEHVWGPHQTHMNIACCTWYTNHLASIRMNLPHFGSFRCYFITPYIHVQREYDCNYLYLKIVRQIGTRL